MTLEKLQSTKNRSDLATLLGYRPNTLSFILYKIPDSCKYTEFTIPKSAGGSRKIKAPISRLKLLQRRLADLLSVCFEEIHGDKNLRRVLSHGFRENYSIITNARKHTNKRNVFNIDLKNFFPSINFGRVRGYFINSRDFQLSPDVATVIAQIACHENELPQGSPVSPVISNLIGHMLDVRLVRMAKKAKCTYSRYVDDITFSTNRKEFPSLIATQTATDEWIPSDKLTNVVVRTGFEINLNKITMQYDTNQQVTTGLVVNKKVNVRALYYRQVRAMCNSLFRTGNYYFGQEMRKSKLSETYSSLDGTVDQLRGVLHYIYNVKRLHYQPTDKNKKFNPTSIHKLCRRFLYYDKFHNLSLPFIICEGKTDSVYVKCALKAYLDEFPSMIEIDKSDLKWKVNFFNHSKFNKDFMHFSGGTGDFDYFIAHYEKRMSKFLSPGRAFPVILLVDNDTAGKLVLKKAANLVGRKVGGTENFYHIVYNLYLVALPLPKGKKNVTIEEYFDSATKKRKFKGKTFQPNDKLFDKDKHYGKHIFAERVVKPNQKSINFSKFKSLLERLEATILDYSENKSSY